MHSMEPSVVIPIRRQPRRADRRPGLHALVREMASDVADARRVSDVSAALASRLSVLAHVRHVRLSEGVGGPPVRPGHPVLARDYAAFAVPLRTGGRHVLLEASFEHDTRPDEWTCQLLESAASLAALVLEAERGALPRGGALAPARDEVVPLIGSSEVMQALRERVDRVAATDFTILIEGESGVGKELVARQIHACSRRRHGPFVAINCAALVETLLEA
ncbi:MAG: sigma 54-interacting transcriptional regulator, partial [Vicinamibacterales bacterium]